MDTEKAEDSQRSRKKKVYSVYNTKEKWCIVTIVAYAAWFSTLTSFIYFPAIHTLSEVFSVSIGKINLTITSYMAVATVAPTLVGDAADILGRRPVYLIVFTIYIGANIAIVLADTYAALVSLRIVQALAISGKLYAPVFHAHYRRILGTFSIAYGVITDVASPAERGTFASVVSFAYVRFQNVYEASSAKNDSITIAPSLGPILGGGLTYSAGWTWIFWFLAIAAGFCLTTLLFVLPETSRKLVGDGSVKPSKNIHRPVLRKMCHWKESGDRVDGKVRKPNPLKSFSILARKDNAIIIFACGFLYVIYTCVNTSLSVLFVNIYNLNQWQAGLVYLPFGIGGTVSAFMSGRLMDRAYRNARANQNLSTDRAIGDDLRNFDIEKARLSIIWTPMLVSTASIVIFGWVLHYHKVC